LSKIVLSLLLVCPFLFRFGELGSKGFPPEKKTMAGTFELDPLPLVVTLVAEV
jgi:hypothetical protein